MFRLIIVDKSKFDKTNSFANHYKRIQILRSMLWKFYCFAWRKSKYEKIATKSQLKGKKNSSLQSKLKF